MRLIPVSSVFGAALALGGVVLAVLWLAATPAVAAFVLYYHAFGDWSVVCSKDEASGRFWCELSAPPPTITTVGPRTVITVSEPTPGNFTVRLNVGSTIAQGQPAFLRVDGNIPHRVQPNRVGEAGWDGADAAAIIDQFKRGRALVVRAFAAWTGAPRDETLSLDGFNEALSTYRAKRILYGATDKK